MNDIAKNEVFHTEFIHAKKLNFISKGQKWVMNIQIMTFSTFCNDLKGKIR